MHRRDREAFLEADFFDGPIEENRKVFMSDKIAVLTDDDRRRIDPFAGTVPAGGGNFLDYGRKR
ncbi:hypothetical protein [Aurantimonas coralicida]|uniref:hypothetical protein n=1 Tax=Aurantimonas coralicida TaxID=182270 RepID=UPI00041B3E2B|nr:hypothetical protein [Aurantimonas coralicida]MCC4298454.1 hypothetical protein [Aurantimonas coralicida]